MAEEKRRKKKPKKKPADQQKKGVFGLGKKAEAADAKTTKNQRSKQSREETVAGNGQVLQAKGALLGKAAAWGFVAFVGVASLITVVNLINPPATAEQVVEAGEPAENQQAAEYARGFVGSWLRATSEDDDEIARYMPVSRSDITEDEPTEFRELSVASVETDDDGLSTVVISAEVYTAIDEDDQADDEITSTDDLITDDDEATAEEEGEDEEPEDSSDSAAASDEEEDESSDEEGTGPQGDEDEEETAWVPTWYQVNVFYDGETFTPMGWPAPVPAPETGDNLTLAYSYDGSDEIEETIADFFEAYVLDSGDVTRLTHPDSTIQPLGSNPYSTVEIGDVTTDEDHRDEVPEDGTATRALVDINLGTTEDTARAATYALTLETRGGRWEVRNLDPAPVLHPDITAEEQDEPTDTVPEENTGADDSSDETEDSAE